MVASTSIVGLCIAAPHFLYAFIWFKPDIWRGYFGRSSVETFAQVAAAGKEGSQGIPLPSKVPTALWIPGLILTVAGQVFNIGIYRAIGKAGVYYGFKLGERIPWHTGFPFNVVSHPQYVGSVLTVWGLGSLVWSQAPPGFTVLLMYWTTLYLLTGFQEQYL